MTKVEKLCELIEKRYGKKPVVSSFRRTRAGHVQRSAGAFSWTVDVEGTYRVFGSLYPVTKLLKIWDCVEMISDRSSYELIPNIKNYNHSKN